MAIQTRKFAEGLQQGLTLGETSKGPGDGKQTDITLTSRKGLVRYPDIHEC